MLNSSDHIYSTTSVQCFWLLLVLRRKGRGTSQLHMRCNTLESIIRFPPFLQWTCGKDELPCLRSGSSGKGGHCQERASSTTIWAVGLLCSSPGCASTAQSSCASFGTATSLSFKWTTVHSCGCITLIAFPLRVCLQRLGGPPLH